MDGTVILSGATQPSEETPVSPIIRIVTAVAVCLAGLGLPAAQAADKKPVQRDLSKDYDDLTPSEHIAIRAAAKAAYKAKKLKVLNVCADPGNMPLSNIKREGFQNKIAALLAESMGARVEYHWRPFIERGLTRETFDQGMCDVMFDVPVNVMRSDPVRFSRAPCPITSATASGNSTGMSIVTTDWSAARPCAARVTTISRHVFTDDTAPTLWIVVAMSCTYSGATGVFP